MIRRYFLLALGITCLVIAAGMALLTDRADAGQPPYGGCEEVLQDYPEYVDTEGADYCRAHGWTLRPRLAVSPRHVLRYYNLPSCRYEDGSGQRQACGWNVTEGDGNGHGLVYIAITRRNGEERYINLRICDERGCRPWRR